MLKPILLIALIQTESGWNPNARSHAGAIGLGQMTPIAVEQVRRVYDIDTNPDLTSPCENLVWSALYFSYVQTTTRTQVEALVAYNGGSRQLSNYRQRLPIAAETDRYWRKVLALKQSYDRTFARIPEPPTARESWVTRVLAGLQGAGTGTYLDIAGVGVPESETAVEAVSLCRSLGDERRITTIFSDSFRSIAN